MGTQTVSRLQQKIQSIQAVRSPLRTIRNAYAKPEDSSHLVETFARAVTSPHNQDVAMLLEGDKGSGKSYSSIRIAFNTARRIADIRERDPDNWYDYFTMDNVAVIDPNRAFEIMGHAKKYNVYVYDDIGVGWNARSFTSKENKSKNDIFQVNRIARTCQIMSLPNQFLIDKVPRMLCNYVAEMDSRFFQHELTTMRVFKPKTVFRLGNKRMTPTLLMGGSKVVRYIIEKPPQRLADEYDRIREEATKLIMEDRCEEVATIETKKRLERAGNKAETERDKIRSTWQARVQIYNERIASGSTIIEAMQASGISRGAWQNAERKEYIVKIGNLYRVT